MIVEGILSIGIGILFILLTFCCFLSDKKTIDLEGNNEMKEINNRIEERRKIIAEIIKKDIPTESVIEEKPKFVLVLDKSGSMHEEYESGRVQEALERVLAIPLSLSNEETLSIWCYDDKSRQLPNVGKKNIVNYIQKEIPFPIDRGAGNNELDIIKTIIKKKSKNDKDKTVVLFFTDGGVANSSQIEKILRENEEIAIFWQFVGIGNANYGFLQDLSQIKNTNFFILDDLGGISDEELYKRLLNAFPNWLKQLKS